MINLTETELLVLLEDFNRLEDNERAAIIDSLQGYFDSDRDTWKISCTPATAIMMDLITYMLESK